VVGRDGVCDGSVRGSEDVYLMMEGRRLESDKLLHVGIHNKGKARRFSGVVLGARGDDTVRRIYFGGIIRDCRY